MVSGSRRPREKTPGPGPFRLAWALFRRDAGALIGGTVLAGAAAYVVIMIVVGAGSVFGSGGGIGLGEGLGLGGDMSRLLLGSIVGVVMAPLIAGLVGMVAGRVREGRPAKALDIFAGYRRFYTIVAAAILVGIPSVAVTLLGSLVPWGYLFLTPLLGLLVQLPFVYLLPALVDGRLGLWRAFAASFRLLPAAGIWRTLLGLLLLAVPGYLLQLPVLFSIPPGGLGDVLFIAFPWVLVIAEVVVGCYVLVYIMCLYYRAIGGDELLLWAAGPALYGRSGSKLLGE